MPAKTRKIKEPEPEPFEVEEEENSLLAEPIPFAEEEETIVFKRSHFYAAVSVLTFFAGILVGYVLWGTNLIGLATNSDSTAQAAGPVVEAPVTPKPQYTRYDIPTEGFHSLGPADAPITIVEFSDYQCPYCRQWQQQVYEDLFAAYPGKIRLVYRNLPLTTIHPEALPAAEAAMCAGDQNAYWQYHDKLFSSENLDADIYLQYARELNLDMPAFESCVNESKFRDVIQADSDFAVNLGVRSTPTFFVNGLAVVGAQPLDVFRQVIDKELAGEIPK